MLEIVEDNGDRYLWRYEICGFGDGDSWPATLSAFPFAVAGLARLRLEGLTRCVMSWLHNLIGWLMHLVESHDITESSGNVELHISPLLVPIMPNEY